MKKILLLGSVASPCPPLKQGGTEWVAYYQAKQLAKRGIELIFIGGKGTIQHFKNQLIKEHEKNIDQLLGKIEFIEIGGNTQYGSNPNSKIQAEELVEASRKLRLETTYLALVQEIIIQRQKEFDLILNNMRGEAIFIPIAHYLNKPIITVTHLNIFKELAEILKRYKTPIITLSNSQRQEFPDLYYLATIPNPINTSMYSFNDSPKNYAVMISTIAPHKNQLDAIKASEQAKIPLILAGKIRDQHYFDTMIKPHIDNKNVIYKGEIGFDEKNALYREAKVFLFPIKWQEPFGLVMIEALACGTPVIAYPNGGPSEIVIDGKNGFLTRNINEMANKIRTIETINRNTCRMSVAERYDEHIVGESYFSLLKTYAVND